MSSIKNQSGLQAKNSTQHPASAHETCTMFIAYIGERFPQLQSLHFRIRKNRNQRLTLRAKYQRRSIFEHGTDFERTMSRFTSQVLQKVSLDKYYPTREAMTVERPLEPFLATIQCTLHTNQIIN